MNRDLLELLQGAGLEHIVLPRKDFIKEHRHLIKLLQKSDDPAFRKEASSQKKELDEMTGGNAKAGFIRRMMWENQHKHDGEYKRPVYPLADDSKMKQPWKFKYHKLANREQSGVNQRNYGASPFITRHFGNVRAEDEDEPDDDDTIPPRPPLDDPRNESRRQRKARKLGFQRNEDYYDEEGEEEPRSQKKKGLLASPSSSSSTPTGAVLPEKKEKKTKPRESDEEREKRNEREANEMLREAKIKEYRGPPLRIKGSTSWTRTSAEQKEANAFIKKSVGEMKAEGLNVKDVMPDYEAVLEYEKMTPEEQTQERERRSRYWIPRSDPFRLIKLAKLKKEEEARKQKKGGKGKTSQTFL